MWPLTPRAGMQSVVGGSSRSAGACGSRVLGGPRGACGGPGGRGGPRGGAGAWGREGLGGAGACGAQATFYAQCPQPATEQDSQSPHAWAPCGLWAGPVCCCCCCCCCYASCAPRPPAQGEPGSGRPVCGRLSAGGQTACFLGQKKKG